MALAKADLRANHQTIRPHQPLCLSKNHGWTTTAIVLRTCVGQNDPGAWAQLKTHRAHGQID